MLVAVLGARAAGWLVSWELDAYDAYLRLRAARAPRAAPVALVWVREEEYREYGHPLPDWVLAEALAKLVGAGATAVGLDIYRDVPVQGGFDALRDVIENNPQVVVVEKFGGAGEPAVPAPAFLEDRSQVGFTDLVVDPDGPVRRGLLYLWDENGETRSSLALQLALRHAAVHGAGISGDPDRPYWMRLGRTTIPPVTSELGGYVGADDAGYQFMLDYAADVDGAPSLSLAQLLGGSFDPETLRGRVVLIGTASPSVKDDFITPLSSAAGGDERIYGAALHAYAIEQLLHYALEGGHPVLSFSERSEALWTLLWCLLGSLVAIRVRSPASLAVVVTLGVAAILASGYAAIQWGWWIPVVPPVLGGLGSLGLVVAYVTQQERSEKSQIMNLFGRFVSRRVATEIWSERGVFMQGGRPVPQRITVTVLMSDLKGYTAASEKMEPGALMEWIGEYMDRMAQLVDEHGGVINDFVGDGLMANFGVPVARTTEEGIDEDARNAVLCALAMAEELALMNRTWAEQGKPTGRLRVGIFTGPAVVGAVGSVERLKYTTVGDTVNTASRLESFEKESFDAETGTFHRILVGAPTFRRVGQAFEAEFLGEHHLRGKQDGVGIYRVWGRASDRSARTAAGEEPSEPVSLRAAGGAPRRAERPRRTTR